jgi:hypothetical protein
MEVRQIDLLRDRLDRDEVPIFYQKLKDPPVLLETGDKEGYPGEYVGEDGNDYYPFIEGNKAWVESNGSVTCDTSYNERMVPVEPAKPVTPKTAEEVAALITTITAPEKDATSLTLPTVEDGYTVAIKSSDKPEVIALDGTITPPDTEETVALVLEVTRTSDNTKADTDSINVVVPAKTVVERTAAEVAGEITTIAAPAKDATSLTLPTVEEGFTVAIKTSDNEGVIALDGTIVPPEDETTVALVLTVTRTSDSTTADTDSINVVVPAKTATP